MPPGDHFIGRVIDRRFTVIAPIGRGGMGTVYRAKQAPLGRQVALKLLAGLTDPERIEEFHRRFFLEAATAAKLSHPNTITIFDYGSEEIEGEDVLFIAMELVEGITLTRALKQGAMHPRRAMNIMMQVAASLREAHEAGVVHRDLKPGNVMLVTRTEGDEHERDFVKVLDFGLAKTFEGAEAAIRLTRAGTFLGSPRYVSPEQIEGRAVDPRADVYSFGCVSYRMLCGHVPFDGDGAVDIMMKHLRDEPPPLPAEVRDNTPAPLVDLVMECLGKTEQARPQDMGEVITRLKLVRAHFTGAADGFFRLEDDEDDADPTDKRPADRAPAAEPSDPPESVFDDDEPSVTNPSGPPEFSMMEDAAEETHNERDPLRTTADRPSARLSDEISVDASLIEETDPRSGADTDEPREDLEDTPRTAPTPHMVREGSFAGDKPAMVEAQLYRYKRRGRKRAVALIVLLLAAGGAFVAWKTGHLQGVERALMKRLSPGSVSREQIDLRLESEPPGAAVIESRTGRVLGQTPLRMRWRIGNTARARTLRLTLDGYMPTTLTLDPPSEADAEQVVRKVKLSKL